MIWWHRRKKRAMERALDAYVAKERAEAEAARDNTRRHAEEARSLREESSKVHARNKKIRDENHFTTWLTHALRGVQEDR